MNARHSLGAIGRLRHSFIGSMMLILVGGIVLTSIASLWASIPIVETIAGMASDRTRVELYSASRLRMVELFKLRKTIVEKEFQRCRQTMGDNGFEKCVLDSGTQIVPLISVTPCSTCQAVTDIETQWDGESLFVVKTPTTWYQAHFNWEPVRTLVDDVAQKLASEEHLSLVLEGIKNGFVATLIGTSTGGVVLSLLVMWLLSRNIRKDFRKLRDFIRSLASNEQVSLPPELRRSGELFILAQDVYGLKRDLVFAQERMREADRMSVWQTMARKVAHEIKNPLTPIALAGEQVVSFASTVKIQNQDRAAIERLEDCGRIIGEEIQSLNRMVQEFTSFARLPKPQMAPHDLVVVVQEFVKRNEGQTEVRLKWVPGASIANAPVSIDQSMIHQILHNLLNNARLADTSRLITCSLTVGRTSQDHHEPSQSPQEYYFIDFCDDGPGVPEDIKEKMFEAYVTTRSTGEKEKGMGLGLAISRQIAMDHGGWIKLVSTDVHGTTMRLMIPESIQNDKSMSENQTQFGGDTSRLERGLT